MMTKEARITHMSRNSRVTPESQKAEGWAFQEAGSQTVGLTEVFVMANFDPMSSGTFLLRGRQVGNFWRI